MGPEKSSMISRERALYELNNALKAMIDVSIEPARSVLLKVQQKLWKILESL